MLCAIMCVIPSTYALSRARWCPVRHFMLHQAHQLMC